VATFATTVAIRVLRNQRHLTVQKLRQLPFDLTYPRKL